MALTPGTRLGPYEIVAAIGAGGMGEVYRAKDTRLNRDVAIKVLPPSFADDPDRRTRFEREAQAVAALNHPNILAIHDIGVEDDLGGRLSPGLGRSTSEVVFLVTELLRGETLRARLGGGPLPVRKAVDIAVQIARGLGAAHGKGIVHRDLKPENIFLVDDGQVKILDFGLARQAAAADHSGATQTMAGTDPGTVMGTVGYMAPEQVRGQAVDARADVFAFGAMLYEMVSGQRAFQRDTAADTMTAILTQDPPELTGSRPELSPALDKIIRHCLEKNANERFQSARDIAFALDALSGSNVSSSASGAAPIVSTRSRRWQVPALVAGVAVVALAAGIALDRSLQPAPTRIEFETKTWDAQTVTNARFGPDGQTLFFSAAKSGTVPSLYTIPPGAVAPQIIGEPGTLLLAVSSKGELAVLTGATLTHHRIYAGTLSRMTRDGAARPWLEHVSELDYAPDGDTVAVVRTVNDRWQVEYPLGKVLYTAPTGYVSDPRVSPDGTRVAFMDHPLAGDDRGTVKVVDASGRVSTLTGEYWGEEGLAWSRDSRTVFFAPADSNAQFDVDAVNVRGTPVIRQVVAGPGNATVGDIAPDGRLLLVRGEVRFTIRALVPGETVERDLSWLDFPIAPSLSRDGTQMAFGDLSQSAGTDYAVALRDIAADKVVRLGPGVTMGISPDAKWAAAQIPSSLKLMVYPTGAGDPVPLEPQIDISRRRVEWFSDSVRVLYCGRKESQRVRCYTRDIRGGAAAAVTPDDVADAILANDDRTLLIRRTSGAAQTMTIGGGAPTDVKGFEADDDLLVWTPDRTGVIVAKRAKVPAPIDRIDLATGKRTRLKELGPTDRTGVPQTESVYWLPDGRGYAYGFDRDLSQVFVVRGVR
jgi:serine/threonine protein kinase